MSAGYRGARLWLLPLALSGAVIVAQDDAQVYNLSHASGVFGEERHYRVFLPADYETSRDKRYPVIYFFHGWSERHNRPPNTGRGYDAGDDYGGDNIARFVATHDVIVVKWDGSNPRTPGEDYVRPYNIPPETHRQFPFYFPELVEHIDATFRTIPDRAHRATAGLSMGGFMSYWVAGKYPHLVGSASSFMGSSEFHAGPLGWPSEYRHTEMHRNYEGLRTRLVIGTRDFIRWYHRRMNAIWDFTRPHHEHEAFDAEHGTPGMARTLAFHLNAFRDPLPRPALWHHIDVYPDVDVWGYSVQTDRRRPGFTAIENVTAAGFRSAIREWLPGGALMPSVAVRVTTDARYQPGHRYWLTDVNLSTGAVRQGRDTADASGRLRIPLDGHLHEVGIGESASPIVVPAAWRVVEAPWATAGARVRLALTLLNKGAAEARGVRATVESPNPGVTFERRVVTLARLAPGESAETRDHVIVTANDPDREVLKLVVRTQQAAVPLEIPLFRNAPAMPDVMIADGVELPVWQRAVNRTTRVVGTGNGNGVADRGETVALAVRDGEAFRLAEVFTAHPCADVSRRVSDPWGSYDNVGASAKWSLVVLSSGCPEDESVPLFLRYQRPSKPEHILVEGTTRLRLAGPDRTPPQPEWAAVHDWNVLELKVRDGAGVRAVRAALRQGARELLVRLNDAGLEGDRAAGDGIFTGLVPSAAPGAYRVTLIAEDALGNSARTEIEDEVQIAPGARVP
jgi:S-formylglutathione hydrolase FrmB